MLVVSTSRMPIGYLHRGRTAYRPRTSGNTTYRHFSKQERVATARDSRYMFVGSMAKIHQIIYMEVIVAQITSTPRPMDTPRSPDLAPVLRSDLRIWPTYYDTESQTICQMIIPPATEPPTNDATWQYHTAERTQTRHSLVVSTSNKPIQDSQPGPDAIAVTVIRETANRIRCSLPPMPEEPASEIASEQVYVTFANYVTNYRSGNRISSTKQNNTTTPLHCINCCSKRSSNC
jgi:hypothetical protein